VVQSLQEWYDIEVVWSLWHPWWWWLWAFVFCWMYSL